MNRLIIDFMAKYFKIIKVRASPLAAVCVSSEPMFVSPQTAFCSEIRL